MIEVREEANTAKVLPASAGTPDPTFLADFFSEAELSKILRKCTRTLRRWHLLRIGPPRITIGRMILYRKSSVTAWLQGNEQVGAARRRR
jgi:hypothetical protein